MVRALARTVGCLGVLAVAGSAAWATRARWLPRVGLARLAPAAVAWSPVTPEATRRGQSHLDQFASPRPPAYATLRPDELVGAVLDALVAALARGAGAGAGADAGPVAAAVQGDVLLVRVPFAVADLAAIGLGRLAQALTPDEPLTLGGTLAVPRRGVGEFRVTRLAVRDLEVPPPVVAPVVERLAQRVHARGITDGALAFALPPGVVDVRVGDGRVVLYGAAP